MITFKENLLKTYGLKVPDNPSKEWCDKRRLQQYYTCNMCGKNIPLKEVIYWTNDKVLHFVCYKCAVWHEDPEWVEEHYPHPIG